MIKKPQSLQTSLSAAERTAGLNQISALRGLYWNDDDKAMRAFIASMKDKHAAGYESHSRTLAALLYLANIPASRHALAFDELTTDEKQALVCAMNQLRAMVSLFPKRLTLPL
ncbi:hypothetical protein EGM70_09630 [Enterobacteriaceae bacterium 89]|nr:hypothetical protein [Enterobacteriaceae bacterium 89]